MKKVVIVLTEEQADHLQVCYREYVGEYGRDEQDEKIEAAIRAAQLNAYPTAQEARKEMARAKIQDEINLSAMLRATVGKLSARAARIALDVFAATCLARFGPTLVGADFGEAINIAKSYD
jgi:hypothetical protein